MKLHWTWPLATALLASGCGGTSASDAPVGAPPTGASPDGSVPAAGDGGSSVSSGPCIACVADSDCGHGQVCAQFDSDTFCALVCASGSACATDEVCTTLSTGAGQQVNACTPRSNFCGPATGTSDAGALPQDGGSGGGSCGNLAGPSTPASCASCGTHPCQPNGCYGGWYCNTTTSKCQSPPATCGSGGGGNDGGGGGVFDGGTPVVGTVGPGGGTVSRLLFTIVGDTRPPTIDDTKGYPSAVISGIYGAIQKLSPTPPFGVSTGDYMFASANGSESTPQLDMYLAARGLYSGTMFPAMGNHECTGATVSNCGTGNTNGVTNNYSTFLSKMLAPLGKAQPYYAINVNATDGSWTAKFLFVAANAWDSAQASWFGSAMAQPTTYTFVIRHEPAGTSGAPLVLLVEQRLRLRLLRRGIAIRGFEPVRGREGAALVRRHHACRRRPVVSRSVRSLSSGRRGGEIATTAPGRLPASRARRLMSESSPKVLCIDCVEAVWKSREIRGNEARRVPPMSTVDLELSGGEQRVGGPCVGAVCELLVEAQGRIRLGSLQARRQLVAALGSQR